MFVLRLKISFLFTRRTVHVIIKFMDRVYNTKSSDDVANVLYTYNAEVNAVDGGYGSLPALKFIRHNGRIVKVIIPGTDEVLKQARSAS